MEIFGVPDCNLSKIDYRIGIEVFTALEECFQRYPLLKNVINCIGDYPFVLEKRNIMAMQAFNQKKVHYDLKALYKTSSFCASYLTFEGTKREYFKTSTGEFLDISDYGIIRSEWENIRQEK